MHRNPSKPGQAPNDLYNRPLVPLGLTEVSTEPAHYAKWLYILVGVDEGGQSVHCPRRPTFKLRVNVTYRQVEVKDSDGALDGFFSIEDAIDKEERQLLMPLARSLHSSTALGSTSLSTWQATAALQWHLPERWEQLAIAKAKGWNLQLTIPKKHGAKMHYDYVRMVQLLPVPGVCRELLKQKLQQWDPSASLSLVAPTPALATVMPPPSTLVPPPLAPPQTTEKGASLAKAQDATHTLTADVEALSQQLQAMAGGGMAATSATYGPLLKVEEVTDAEEQHAPRIPGYKQAARALHALVCVISAEAAPPPESAPHGHVHCTQRAPHGLDAADHAATVCSLHAPHVQFKLGNTYRQAGVLLQNGALHGCQQLGHAVQVDAHAAQGVHLHGELAVAILEGWDVGGTVGRPGRAGSSNTSSTARVACDYVRLAGLLQIPPSYAELLPPGAWLWSPSRGV